MRILSSNVEIHFPTFDVPIVGFHFKKDGLWENTVDYDRVIRFMSIMSHWRNNHE